MSRYPVPRVGQQVWLAAWTDPSDPTRSQPREQAHVLDVADARVDDPTSTVIVQLHEYDAEREDGVREVPLDQLEPTTTTTTTTGTTEERT